MRSSGHRSLDPAGVVGGEEHARRSAGGCHGSTGIPPLGLVEDRGVVTVGRRVGGAGERDAERCSFGSGQEDQLVVLAADIGSCTLPGSVTAPVVASTLSAG